MATNHDTPLVGSSTTALGNAQHISLAVGKVLRLILLLLVLLMCMLLLLLHWSGWLLLLLLLWLLPEVERWWPSLWW